MTSEYASCDIRSSRSKSKTSRRWFANMHHATLGLREARVKLAKEASRKDRGADVYLQTEYGE